MVDRTVENYRTPKSSFTANSAFSILAWGAPLVFSFIITPYLIRNLGIEQYGYYSLVLAVIGSGFTTGIGKVSAKYIPEHRASGNDNELSKILFVSLLLTISVAIFEGLIIALANPFIVEGLLNVPTGAQAELKAAIGIACLIGPVSMVSQLFQSAAQGLHLFRMSSVITILAALAVNSGTILLAVYGHSYFDIFIWNLIVATSALVLYILFVKRYLPEFTLDSGTDAAAFKRVARFTISIFIYQSIMSVLFIFERAFVLRHFGAEALTFYTLPLMLGVYLHALIVSFSQAAVPRMNEKLARPDELADFYQYSTKIVLSVTSIFLLGYLVLGREFLTLWLGMGFADRSYSLLLLHGSAFALIAILINCWMLAEATHRYALNAVISSVISIIGVAAIASLGPSFGLDGVAAGRLIGAALILPMIPFLESRVFGSSMPSFWLINVAKVAIASLVSCFVITFIVSFLGTSWSAFTIAAVLLAMTFAAMLYLLRFFSVDELKETRMDYRG